MVPTGKPLGGGPKRFVGFGFGPIQAGLMLLQAVDSGAFDAYCLVEIDPELVAAVRRNGGSIVVNIAGRDGIVKRRLQGFTILNPRVEQDRLAIGGLVEGADEMATAIPSVEHYGSGGEASVAGLIARNANQQKPQIVYAAENHNFAAEILRAELGKHVPDERLGHLNILNTVIGKMSGLIQEREEMEKLGIEPVVPGWTRAILVEEFSRILVSRPTLPGVSRGIAIFEEKDDLLPFEEAKLYGHNAIHSLLGYLAAWKGYEVMSRIRDDRRLYELGLAAFLEESGAPLIKRHRGMGDALFTETGYAAYAQDLMERMTNPFLHDKVERICRDPARKLALSDRLFGTMQVALAAGVTPRRLATGAAAAIGYARARKEAFATSTSDTAAMLRALWASRPAEVPARESSREAAETCIRLVLDAERRLERGELPE